MDRLLTAMVEPENCCHPRHYKDVDMNIVVPVSLLCQPCLDLANEPSPLDTQAPEDSDG